MVNLNKQTHRVMINREQTVNLISNGTLL